MDVINNDRQTEISSICEEMLNEGIPLEKITSRQVASKTSYSHTTVLPYITAWRELRAHQEREAIKQTQMTSAFVKALHSEVEARVAKLREVDSKEYEVLGAELEDLTETNKQIESELRATRDKLTDKIEECSRQTTLADEYKSENERLLAEHQLQLATLEERYKADIEDLKSAIIEQQSKFESEKSTIKHEHREEIHELTAKNDSLHIELQGKIAELSLVTAKVDSLSEVSKELELCRSELLTLGQESMRHKVELDGKSEALIAAARAAEDNIEQRDIAQALAANNEREIKQLQERYSQLLILAVSNGVKKEDIDRLSSEIRSGDV